MDSMEVESGRVKGADIAWYAERRGAVAADWAGCAVRSRLAAESAAGLRDAITEALPGLVALDRRGAWTAAEIGEARALIRQMDEAARQLEIEKGYEMRRAMSERSTG